jgi:hypothetical protein
MVTPVLVVRLYGVITDNTFEPSGRILVAETLLLSLSAVALFVSRSRPRGRHSSSPSPAFNFTRFLYRISKPALEDLRSLEERRRNPYRFVLLGWQIQIPSVVQ